MSGLNGISADYVIVDAHSTLITQGIPWHRARACAQRLATRLRIPVWLCAAGDHDPLGVDPEGELFEP